MSRLMAILVVGLAATSSWAAWAAWAADDDVKAELKRLEGNWEITTVVFGGTKAPAGSGAPEKAVVKDGKVSFLAGGKEMPTFKDLKITIDLKAKPTALDLQRGEKEVLPCIYELKENDLKLVMPAVPTERKPGELLERPKTFETKDKPLLLLVAKRVKS